MGREEESQTQPIHWAGLHLILNTVDMICTG